MTQEEFDTRVAVFVNKHLCRTDRIASFDISKDPYTSDLKTRERFFENIISSLNGYDLSLGLFTDQELSYMFELGTLSGRSCGKCTDWFPKTRYVNPNPVPVFRPFMMTINTETGNPGSSNFVLPLPSAGVYDYYVDWGEGGAEDHFMTNTDQSHDYALPGVYQISIRGVFPQIQFAGHGSLGDKVVSIDQWGDIVWQSMEGAFQSCSNMTGTYTDIPDTSLVENFSSMFYQCDLFNSPVSFITSSATNMAAMFSQAPLFNQSVASFDTSNVTDMSDMFNGATTFNQSVANFDTSNVEWFFYMFAGCIAFKQSLATFSLDSCIDIDWFLFGADINETGTTINYDATLVAWAAADVPDGLVFDGGDSKYSDTGQTARNSLIGTDGWEIYDGGHI